ncbi:hypothetical protein BC832DRAFT_568544, partial [Gaertneriomyces semiglobifer]
MRRQRDSGNLWDSYIGYTTNYSTTNRADFTPKIPTESRAELAKVVASRKERIRSCGWTPLNNDIDWTTTQRRDYQMEGFDPAQAAQQLRARSAVIPAGCPISSETKSLRYSSDSFADYLAKHKRTTNNRHFDIFLPPLEQYRREGGVQTFGDWPEIGGRQILSRKYSDAKDEQNSIRVTREEDMRRRQALISKRVMGNLTIGLAG